MNKRNRGKGGVSHHLQKWIFLKKNMDTIILLSESIVSLDLNATTKSTQNYELNLANSLSNFFKVTILSFAFDSNGAIENKNDIRLYGVGLKAKKYKKLREYLKSFANSFLLFWGYDFLKTKMLLKIERRLDIIIVPFIYDSHKPAIQDYFFFKKILASIYFSLGKSLIKYFDGLILFQEPAARKLHFKKECLVTKPGARISSGIIKKTSMSHFKIVYAGTLSQLNGIDVLLDCFQELIGDDIELNVYGDGKYKNAVIQRELVDSRIKYHGVVNADELNDAFLSSHVLLNLRKPNDESSLFAFPSKLFDMIATGVPVISTKVLNDDEFINNICCLDELTKDELLNALINVKNNYEFYLKKASVVKRFVIRKYSYSVSAEQIHQYLLSLKNGN